MHAHFSLVLPTPTSSSSLFCSLRWELKEAEKVERARREAEREEIDKRARELQSLGADVIAQHMLRVKMQRDMEDKMAKMSTAVAVVSARGGDRDLGGGCFVGDGQAEPGDDTTTPPSETEDTARAPATGNAIVQSA